MELDELIAYARNRYAIEEQHKWQEFPGFSVLSHPQTGKWIALLMRQWDTDRGREIQRCDLKCGAEILQRRPRAYLSRAVRMRGKSWIGITFDDRTEREVVYPLFDRAVEAAKPLSAAIEDFLSRILDRVNGPERPRGYTVDVSAPSTGNGYRDTALPPPGSVRRTGGERVPQRLREMRRLYEYGRETPEGRARNFYRQAVFMADYEDVLPWEGEFSRYFPTYHDMDTRQLRGYFTWRTQMRRGEARPISTSAAYLYVYELLNGVGADTPEECLQRLEEFDRLFLESGVGDVLMRPNLRRWMAEFAILHDLPAETVRRYTDPAQSGKDQALAALHSPENHTDAEIFSALCELSGKKLETSPVLAADPERGRALFAACWRGAASYSRGGRRLFGLCFGRRTQRRWYPMANAVYYDRSGRQDREYVLNECRVYRCRGGLWQTSAYEMRPANKPLLRGFLHETEALLRRYLGAGRPLKEKEEDAWAIPYINAAIEADRQTQKEKARRVVTIDLSGLDRIRADAIRTRDSLLVGEETEEAEERPVLPTEGKGPVIPTAPEKPVIPTMPEKPVIPTVPETPADGPLDAVQTRILRALLAGEDPAPILRGEHLMPSLVADAINEALFEEIGDTVLLCEDERLLLVDDYTEDLRQILGG